MVHTLIMTTTTKTTRETVALEVLRAGGFFRYALERGYHGGEKFKMHLHAANRSVVKGIGHATKRALESALVRRPVAVSSAWPQEWVLDPAANSARLEWLGAAEVQ